VHRDKAWENQLKRMEGGLEKSPTIRGCPISSQSQGVGAGSEALLKDRQENFL